MRVKIAVIGSFHRHYDLVREACRTFADAGHTVTSPSSAELVRGDDVRFEDDAPSTSEATLQTLTLERIMAADVVYVVAPEGYVGRATSYELGRLIQAAVPVYFSSVVHDPPLAIPATHVATPEETLERIGRIERIAPLHAALDDAEARAVESRLVAG